MCIALHPSQLTFIRLEDFHPDFGAIGMRCICADRLDVHAGDRWGRIGNRNGRMTGKEVFIIQGIVISSQNDGGCAIANGATIGNYTGKVSNIVQILEKIETRLGIIQGATIV